MRRMEPEENRQFVAKAARLSTPGGLLPIIEMMGLFAGVHELGCGRQLHADFAE